MGHILQEIVSKTLFCFYKFPCAAMLTPIRPLHPLTERGGAVANGSSVSGIEALVVTTWKYDVCRLLHMNRVYIEIRIKFWHHNN